MINKAESRMKSCGQNVAPKIWNLLSDKSHKTAWRPSQLSQTVPKNSKNRKPAPTNRSVRNSPVKLRVWIRLSLDLFLCFAALGREASKDSSIWTGICSLMVFRSSASIRPVHYDQRTVCITDSAIRLKTVSDAFVKNLRQLAAPHDVQGFIGDWLVTHQGLEDPDRDQGNKRLT